MSEETLDKKAEKLRKAAEDTGKVFSENSARLRDAEIRRLLGKWVSECEPQLVYGPNGIAGLAAEGERFYDGPVPIVVPAETVEIAITCGAGQVGSVAIAMSLEECRRREEAAARDLVSPYLTAPRWMMSA